MSFMTDAGVVLVSTAAIFTARVVCEQTLLAWTRGAQRVSFSPSHSSLDTIGILFVLFAIVWALVVLILGVLNRSRISETDWTLIAVLIVCCGLWLIPYEQWKLLMVRAHGTKDVPKSWVVT